MSDRNSNPETPTLSNADAAFSGFGFGPHVKPRTTLVTRAEHEAKKRFYREHAEKLARCRDTVNGW